MRYTWRYDAAADIEIAGLLAAGFAYGRVDLFFPILDRVFAWLDQHGGPRQAIDTATVDRDGELLDLVYRFNRGIDLVILFSALRALLEEHETLEAVFGDAPTALERLTTGVGRIRAAAVAVAPEAGLAASTDADLPNGLRYLLASPKTGSSCKRWNLFLRWMVRPPIEQIDRGIWSTWQPAMLVMPVDVHVHRIARFVGLTDRATNNWRTAEAITARLRDFDADDPVRYDFAIAHLGISGDCVGRRVETICPRCPLDPVCTAHG